MLFKFSDIDECTLGTHNCDINGQCSNTVGSFTCSCNTGYAGDGVNCAGKYRITRFIRPCWYFLEFSFVDVIGNRVPG